MLRRRFGKTNIDMPVFSTGGMRYQMNWTDTIPDKLDSRGQRNVAAIIEKSLSLGLNHIETARGYGTSEYQLGRILPALERDSFILQSKIPPDKDPAKFLKDFELSMNLLGVDTLDLLGIHGINLHEHIDWCEKPNGCFAVIDQLKKEGRVKHVGFSTHADADVIHRAIDTGYFSYVNLHWYYIYQRNQSCIEHASSKDMGVFIISPNDKGGMLYKPSQKLLELTAPYSPMVYNDLFCLQNQDVHTLSLGAAKPSDFDEHLKVIGLFEDSAPQVENITRRLNQQFIHLMGKDFMDNWYELTPPWHEIPGHVNIRVIVWLWMLSEALDLTEYGKMRYNLIGNGEHWFAGEMLKPEHFPAIDKNLTNHPYKEKIMEILHDARRQFHAEPVKRLSQS